MESWLHFFGEDIQLGNVLLDNKTTFGFTTTVVGFRYPGRKREQQRVPSYSCREDGIHRLLKGITVHDSRDIIWISTYGNGLYAYDTTKDGLNHFTAGMGGLSHIASDYLFNITEDRSSEVWVSSEFSGISRISVINEGLTVISPKTSRYSIVPIRSAWFRGLDDGTIWMGTRKGGLCLYDENFQLKYVKKRFSLKHLRHAQRCRR